MYGESVQLWNPRPRLNEELGAVSCTTDVSCSAGGNAIHGGNSVNPEYELLERWNGRQLRAVVAPRGSFIVDGMSCWRNGCLAAFFSVVETHHVWSKIAIELPDLMFPEDGSWLISTLWDDDWTCIGGPQKLIADLLLEPILGSRARRVSVDQDATPPGHVSM